MELFRVIPVENGFWALERLRGGESLGLVPCYFTSESEARFRMERLIERIAPAQA